MLAPRMAAASEERGSDGEGSSASASRGKRDEPAANKDSLRAFPAMLTPSQASPRRGRLSALSTRLEAADVKAALSLARAKDHRTVRVLAAISEVGGWKSLLALSAGTLAFGRIVQDRRLAGAGRDMLRAGLLASLAKTALKRMVHRTRPNVLMDEGIYARGWKGAGKGPWQSFPSGHSAMSVAVARAVARSYPEVRDAAYLTAAGVIAIQLLRGSHFPSDVAAGAFIGLSAEAVTNRWSNVERDESDGLPTGRCLSDAWPLYASGKRRGCRRRLVWARSGRVAY